MGRSTVYNNIVKDNYTKVCNENKELLDEFLEYCEVGGKSKTTLVNYTSDIKIFFTCNLINNKNIPFYKATKRNLIKYQNYLMKELGLGDSRIKRLKSSLSSLSSFAENVLEEEVEEWKGFRNIINKLPPTIKGEPRREKTIMGFDEVKIKILDKLVEKGKYQQACCIALATYGGARKSELGRFKVEYFKDEYVTFGCWYKTPEKIEVKGRGDHRVYKYTLKNEFKPYLDLWLKQREGLGIDSEWLFVAKNKSEYTQATDITLDGWMKSINKIVEEDLYFHLFRHTFVSHLKQMGLPNDVVIEIMKWAKGSDVMVSIYNDTNVMDEMGQYFNEEGIVKIEEAKINNL